MAKKKSRSTWKKLLWLKQDFPDNHTDSSFLSQLKRNTTVVNYSYGTLVTDFSLILLHLCMIFLVLLVFYGVYSLQWNPLVPVSISSLVTLAAYLACHHLQTLHSTHFEITSKSTALILLVLLILSPVLKSLTRSTSSDSIWALSCWLCVMNFLFNDYSLALDLQSDSASDSALNSASSLKSASPPAKASSSRKNLSKNISLSNAIVLLSRLNTNVSVFSFVLLSIQINGLLPILNNALRARLGLKYHYSQLLVTVCGVDALIYYEVGLRYLAVVVFAQLVIVVVGPLYFIWLQRYKDELQGPWDPLKPVLTTAENF